MRFLRNLFLTATVLSLGFFSIAQAQDYGLKATADVAKVPTSINGATTVPLLVGEIVSIVLGLFGIIFFLLIFYAGFNWMIAQGNTEKIDQSKNTLQSAAIGLIIVLAAYAITNFVFSSLNAPVQYAQQSAATTCDSASVQDCAGKQIGNSCVSPNPNATCKPGATPTTCTCN